MNPYKIAWSNLINVLKKGYPLQSWIAPIPEEKKKTMLEKGVEFLKRQKALEREPLLFND